MKSFMKITLHTIFVCVFTSFYAQNPIYQPYNNFTDSGSKFFSSVTNNRFLGRSATVKVLKNNIEISDSDKKRIFDGNFDSKYVTDNSQTTLLLDFKEYNLTGSQGFTYAPGYFKVAFYPGGQATVQNIRWKNRDGVWRDLVVENDYNYGGSSAVIGYSSRVVGNWIVALEITLVPDTTNTHGSIWLTEIEYIGTRMSLEQGPLITTSGGKIYGNLEGFDKTTKKWKLDADGIKAFPSSTIGLSDLNNSGILVGSSTEGIGIDKNEIVSKGADLFMGTLSNHDVNIVSGGNTALTVVEGNNYVGIGTPSPASKLEIKTISGNNLIRSVSGSSSISGIDFGDVDQDDIARLRYDNSNNLLTMSTHYDNASIAIIPNGSGNVGIGTDAPSEKLEVDGDVKANKFLGDWDGANVSEILFKGANSENWNNAVKNGIYRKKAGANSPFGGGHATLLNIGIHGGKGHGFQIVSDNSEKLKYRGFFNKGSFNPWYDIYHSGNFSKSVIQIGKATSSDNNSPGIVMAKNDDFLYDGQYINHYGFGFHGYKDNPSFHDNPANAYMSGYFGIDFFTGKTNRMRISSDGIVSIGTVERQTGYKLAVNGKIKSREVKVTVDDWADFVFEKDYDLPTLAEVEQHIREKGYLKDIPSAADVEKNGIFLGEMNAKLLQKIEELTLYTIEQEKILKSQENKIKLLEEEKERNDARLKKIEKFLQQSK
jgi:hypothetical protein